MPINVLIVDDSAFFRRRLTELLAADPRLHVVGTAANGREAVDKTLVLHPDVITMDHEMPVMDGTDAVREIMKRCPTPVLMFSSLTREGAQVTLDALEAGAVDYLTKNFEDLSNNPRHLQKILCDKVYRISGSNRKRLFGFPRTERPALKATRSPADGKTAAVEPSASSIVVPSPGPARRKAYRLVAIGTSTGGPVALQTILTQIPANFPAPILLIQHMPAAFTGAFAERLDKICHISVKEAADGDLLRPGQALLAPGGKQMLLDSRNAVRILPSDPRLNYKPCVDITFASVASILGDKALAVVLTGMGADGRDGARLLKEAGSQVWAQDEASCVIYGMPMAVVKAGYADAIYPLDDMAQHLTEACL